MTSVAPPPPPPPPTGVVNAGQLTVSVPPQASVQLAQMAVDSFITGLIKPPLPDGQLLLQSPLGPLPLKAPFVLPPGVEATFKLIQTVPAVQMQLTHIDGKPVPPNTPAARVLTMATQSLQQGVSQNLLGGAQQAQSPLSGQQAATTSINSIQQLNNATGLRAFVLNTPTPAGASANANTGQAATQNTGQPPSGTTTPSSGTQTSSSQGSQATQQTGTSQAGSNVANRITIQQGNQLNVRLLNVQLPGGRETQSNQPATPNSSNTVILQGQVQGQTGNKQPIIQTARGQIALDTQTKIPEGTQVKLEILSSSKPEVRDLLQTLTPKDPLQTLAQKWPAMEEALKVLTETNPVIADQVQNNLVPKPDQRLAANMIFFLKALGRGSFKNWSDDQTLRAIARAKPELAKKLEGDFSTLSDKSKQPTSTDWKIAYVPIFDDGRLDQIRIAQRDHKEEQEDGKEDPGVRFVIDINFSNIGDMQFDGLAKDSVKKFDLIIRTHAALAGFMRRDIHDIFAHGMDVLGFDGKISFQVTSQFVKVEGNEGNGPSLNIGMLV